MAAALPKSFKPKATKAAVLASIPKKRGHPPKFTKDPGTPPSQVVSVPLGTNKPPSPSPVVEAPIVVPSHPAPKATKLTHAPLPKPGKAKLLLKAALKEDPSPTPTEVEAPALPLSVATPSPPSITHVNTALPQAPGRKIAQPTKRVQTATGKLSFDSIIAQQNQPVDVASPANDLLRFLKK